MSKTKLEDQFQHLSEREAILLRPDTYLGDVSRSMNTFYVPHPDSKKMYLENLDISMGVIKVFLEPLQNACDAFWTVDGMTHIKVSWDVQEGSI